MGLLLLSFVAGVLTVLAPCVLPILPVIVGGSVVHGKKSRPWVIIAAFSFSILFFTLLLQWLVQTVGLQPSTLTKISATILILFGILLLFPQLWQMFMHLTGIEKVTNKAQQTTASGIWGDILLGAVLGPVFNTCSPTYAVLVANILPVSFLRGLTNIVAYIVGLGLILGLIAYGGRHLVEKMKWASNPKGWFKKAIAVLLILVGVSMLMKWDKAVESWLIQQHLIIDTTQREIHQVEQVKEAK